MSVVSMKQLLEAGVHFGHTTRRWNPKMEKYIYTARNGIYIFDLKKTAESMEVAYKALFDIVYNDGKRDGKVLFVGTKKQAQDAVYEEALRTGQYYVNQRWLGGTLTNFQTIKERIKRLKSLYKMEESGHFELLPKKEVVGLIKERERLEKFLSGIKEMEVLPNAIYIVDPKKEINAIREARILGIPVFGIVDTNCDPDDVDYIIPANDDAIRAVKLITSVLGNAIIEAQGGTVEGVVEDDEEVVQQTTSYQTPDEDEPKKVEPKPKKVKKVEKPEVKQPAKEKVVEEVKEVVEETVNLESLTVAKLKELAKEQGVPRYSAMRKAELIEALKK